MAKVEVVQAFTSGENDDITIIDSEGRVWLLVEERWIRLADVPDIPEV